MSKTRALCGCIISSLLAIQSAPAEMDIYGNIIDGETVRARRETLAKLNFLEKYAQSDRERDKIAKRRRSIENPRFFDDSALAQDKLEGYLAEIDREYYAASKRRTSIAVLVDAFKRGVADFSAIACFSWRDVWHNEKILRYPPLFSSYTQIGRYGSLRTYLAEAIIEKWIFLLSLGVASCSLYRFFSKRVRNGDKAKPGSGCDS